MCIPLTQKHIFPKWPSQKCGHRAPNLCQVSRLRVTFSSFFQKTSIFTIENTPPRAPEHGKHMKTHPFLPFTKHSFRKWPKYTVLSTFLWPMLIQSCTPLTQKHIFPKWPSQKCGHRAPNLRQVSRLCVTFSSFFQKHQYLQYKTHLLEPLTY